MRRRSKDCRTVAEAADVIERYESIIVEGVECLCNIENYSVQTDMMTDKPKRIGAAVK
jgi:hypothetical protein